MNCIKAGRPCFEVPTQVIFALQLPMCLLITEHTHWLPISNFNVHIFLLYSLFTVVLTIFSIDFSIIQGCAIC